MCYAECFGVIRAGNLRMPRFGNRATLNGMALTGADRHKNCLALPVDQQQGRTVSRFP